MKKIVIGLSGGVDSAVAAYLLKEKGYEVTGVTLRMYKPNVDTEASDGEASGEEMQEAEGVLSSDAEIADAQRICTHLGIPHVTVDMSQTFRSEVIDYFAKEYLEGRTPNPCCRCNRAVKFHGLLSWALENGYDGIATGHYARIVKGDNQRYTVQKSLADTKDQTYALYCLSREELEKTMFPLGEYTKDEVRTIAMKINLPVAEKKESQDICFIPDKDYGAFLREYSKTANISLPGPGRFVDESGKVLGEHTGYTDYTIGQRKGLGIAMGHRIFVSRIDPVKNEVTISDEDVFGNTLTVGDVNYMAIDSLPGSLRAFAKIRYAHKGEWCTVSLAEEEVCNKDVGEGVDEGIDESIDEGGKLVCVFDNPVRAITPGQAVVFYDNDSDERKILFGGTINYANQS